MVASTPSELPLMTAKSLSSNTWRVILPSLLCDGRHRIDPLVSTIETMTVINPDTLDGP